MNLWKFFVEKVEAQFRFLETDLGFVRTMAKLPNIIYESDKLQVQVYYNVEGQYELDLGIRRLADGPGKLQSLGIGMLMRLNGQKDGYPSPFPSTPELLETEIKNLAELLQKHGQTILSGNLSDFERMEQAERELTSKFETPKE
jgi:hypothetical protein